GMLGLVDQAIQAVRNVSHSLRPVQLGMGSIAAIEWLCTELTKHSGISCALKAVDDIDALPENIALILFRIVQESLTNVARHAAATGVDITITTSNGAIKVEIRDNGKGFDVKNLGVIKSFGLLGMSERAISIGGELNVTSKLGQGTIITLHIPNDPTTGAKSEKFATAGDASAGK
ncbi:MAG: PAS sensor protein, partial [uncultured bacterium]